MIPKVMTADDKLSPKLAAEEDITMLSYLNQETALLDPSCTP